MRPQATYGHASSTKIASLVTRGVATIVAVLSLGRLVEGLDMSGASALPAGVRSTFSGVPGEAAGSVEELMDRFLTALAAGDEAALHRLRVTKHEYLDSLVPLTVPPGEPPRRISDRPKEFFWQVLDLKSRLYAARLLERFGGRRYAEHALTFSRPERQYAGYTAYGGVRLALTDQDGVEHQLRTGWVAEVGGRFKFIGFASDD